MNETGKVGPLSGEKVNDSCGPVLQIAEKFHPEHHKHLILIYLKKTYTFIYLSYFCNTNQKMVLKGQTRSHLKISYIYTRLMHWLPGYNCNNYN